MKTGERDSLIGVLKVRFEQHSHRHAGIAWSDVLARLRGNAAMLRSLAAMESTGGEPDVIGLAQDGASILYCDCSAESPEGRRSVCYDRAALDSRKEHKPKNSAVDMAMAVGISILTEEQYRALQKLEEFDTKTSSWVSTPLGIRSLGGALFCDRRYDTVFVYHNGAQSYYASRGFRGLLIV